MKTQDKPDYLIRACNGLNDFTPAEWASLSATSKHPPVDSLDQRPSAPNDTERTSVSSPYYNPFLSYAYLSALEDSGCVGSATGWLPHYIRLEDDQGELLAAAPAYLKAHSQGEYVFDQGWAEAFERAGGNYYPKLQLSIPFTPASGPRLLSPARLAANNQLKLKTMLAHGIIRLTEHHQLSSAHVTFVEQSDIETLQQAGFLHRTDQQFHFFNQNYNNYDDFLAELTSRKRKALKRERREALADGITIDLLTGADLTEEIWDISYQFYRDTGDRKWGRPYLNRQFYSLIGERMREDILLIMAKRNGRYIAGAINFIGSDRLFGRHWGCIEDHPFLHFEICYHQAIDYAIENKLLVVEAGAQGDHKIARGYLPVTTHSAHYISNPSFRSAVADYLAHETRDVAQLGEILKQHSPFKKHSN